MRLINRDNLQRLDLRLILVLITYTLLGLFLLRYYQYQINPDGIQYIGIAKGYMTGAFYKVISAYYGPLLSWLMIPFLFFAKTPVSTLYSTKLLSLTLGFFTIIGLRQLSYRFKMEEVVRTVVLFTAIPVVLYFALSVITPDLLMVCVLVYYLAVIFDPDYPSKLSHGVICGLLGVLAYLTKSYGFTFFIASFLVLNVLHYFRNSPKEMRKKVLKNLILGFTVFLAISGIWIGLISGKEGKLTFGTSGTFNHALVGPQSQGFPQYSQGISKPGEVNSNFEPKEWSPFSSWYNFRYQLNLIKNNTIQTMAILNSFSCLSLLILLAYILMCIQPPRRLILHGEVVYPLVTVLISAGGYLMILVEERYIWLIYVLLILMGGHLINMLFKTDFFTKERFAKVRKAAVLLIFAYSFVVMPANYLAGNLHTGEDIYNLSSTLMGQYGVHGNVATNDQLTDLNYLAYYMNITVYGQAQKNISSAELQNDLEKCGVEYYLVWGSNQSVNLTGYNEITRGNLKDLKVYSLN